MKQGHTFSVESHSIHPLEDERDTWKVMSAKSDRREMESKSFPLSMQRHNCSHNFTWTTVSHCCRRRRKRIPFHHLCTYSITIQGSLLTSRSLSVVLLESGARWGIDGNWRKLISYPTLALIICKIIYQALQGMIALDTKRGKAETTEGRCKNNSNKYLVPKATS